MDEQVRFVPKDGIAEDNAIKAALEALAEGSEVDMGDSAIAEQIKE